MITNNGSNQTEFYYGADDDNKAKLSIVHETSQIMTCIIAFMNKTCGYPSSNVLYFHYFASKSSYFTSLMFHLFRRRDTVKKEKMCRDIFPCMLTRK